MITKLVAEQEALIPKLYDEYLAIGLNTEPINVAEMKKVIDVWYRAIKQPEPAYFVFSSPAICSIFCTVALSRLDSQLRSRLYSQLDSQLRSQLDSQLDSQLSSQLRSRLYSQLSSQLDSQLYSQLDSQLSSQLRSQLYSQLDSQLRSQLDSQLRSQLDSQLRSRFESSYWCANLAASWISFYKCGEQWGVKYTPKVKTYLDQWDHIARYGFNWWPRAGVAVLSDRPRHIHFNAERRLHADGKMAVEFSDGWGVYCYDGVRLPEKYGAIKAKDWKPEWFVKEENVELKRILAQSIGYEKMFHSLEAKKLDAWREYELFRIENVDVEPVHILTMVCPSTGKKHFGRVPPDCLSARDAATARNRGIDPESFWIEQ